MVALAAEPAVAEASSTLRATSVFMLDLLSIVPYYTAHLCAALGGRPDVRVELGSIRYYLDRGCFERMGVCPSAGVDLVSRAPAIPRPLRRALKAVECLLNLILLSIRFHSRQPDVLHVQFLPLVQLQLPFELWFLHAAKRRGTKIVYTVHNVLPHDSAHRHRALYQRLYGAADHLICHDVAARACLMEEFGLPAEKISVIPHGQLLAPRIPSSRGDARQRLGIAPDGPLVLWQGILRPYKGVKFLLRAWPEISRNHPDARLAVVGSGDPALMTEIRDLVNALDMPETVRLELRFISVSELEDFHTAADILVYPYAAATTSGALMTGIGYNRPIVASRLPAFEQLLHHGDNSLLASYGDTAELARELGRLIGDPDLRRRLAHRLRETCQREPGWDLIAQQTVAECYQAPVPTAETAPVPGSDAVNELRQLLRQSSHYLLGLLASLALGFVSFPIYTRVFSVADYGLIDFAQKIVLLVVALSKCGIQNSALRFYNREAFAANPDAERRYYATMLFGVLAPATIVTLVFTALIHWAPQSVVDLGLAKILMLAGGLILLRSTQSILWSFLRIEERTKAYNVVSLIMRAATIAAGCALLPVLGASVETYFAGTLLVEAAVVVALVLPLVRRGLLNPAKVDAGMARAAFAFGLPLVLQEIAGLVLDSGDRVLIRHFLTDHALGLYSVAYGLAGYVNTLLMAPLGLAILPLYLKFWNAGGEQKTAAFLGHGLDGFFIAAALIMALACAGARDAVFLLASSRYAGAERLIPTLVGGLLIYTTQVFLNAGLLIHKKTGKMAAILGWSAALNLALNWVLLPRIGLQGAAVATLIAYLVCTVWLAQSSFRLLPLRISWWALGRYSAAAALSWLAASAADLGAPIWNVAVKCAIVFVVYFAALYAIDSRIRLWSALLYRRILGPADMVRVGLR